MKENLTPWEKENIRLFQDELGFFEAARIQSESANDSDFLRASLRNTAQLVDDLDQGKTLWLRRNDGTTMEMSPTLFHDPVNQTGEVLRRSLILFPSSRERLNDLQKRLKLRDISAVARFSLRFFSRIVAETVAGGIFFVRDNKGVVTIVRFGAFSSTPENPVSPKDKQDGEPNSPLPHAGGVFASPTRPKSSRISEFERDELRMK